MPQLVDCPECACLIDADERACPFCGATPRRVAMTSLLSLGFMLGLTTASCGDKNDTTQGTVTETATTVTGSTGTDGNEGSTSPTMPTTAYAGSPESTNDSLDSVGTAYAGPPSTSTDVSSTGTTDDTDTSTGTSTDTSTDTSTSSSSTDSSTTIEGTTEIGQSTAYAGATSMSDPLVPEDGQ
jgi:hypothetical protein